MTMHLCFHARAGVGNVFARLINVYAGDPALRISCVAHNAFEARQYRARGIAVTAILQDYLDAHWKRLPDDTSVLSEFEERYGPEVPVWQMVYSDRFLRRKDSSYICRTTAGLIRFWEHVLDQTDPDYLISEPVVGMWNFIPYAICRRRRSRYAGVLTLRLLERIYLTDTLYGRCSRLDSEYERARRVGLARAQRVAARDFIARFRTAPQPPTYMAPLAARRPRPWLTAIPRFLTRTVREFIRYYFLGNNDYTVMPPVRSLGTGVTRAVRGCYYRSCFRYDEPELQTRYVLFPLHYSPEASTDVWAPYGRNQVEVIRQVAQSLPADCLLYVKEHRTLLGHRPVSAYRVLRSLPNVRLLSPACATSELISRSLAVCVLTSTVGLEAILLGKPVIVLGEVFYDCFKGVRKVRDLHSLPGVFHAVLRERRSPAGEEDLAAFVHAYLNSGHPGDFTFLSDGTSDRAGAAQLLAAGLLRELRENGFGSGTNDCGDPTRVLAPAPPEEVCHKGGGMPSR